MVKTARKRASNRAHDQRRREAKPWRKLYLTQRWKALRLGQLTKQPLCERCRARGQIIAASVVHHKRPHKGNEELFFDPANLTSSCADCHDTLEQRIEARGYEFGSDSDGRPIDPNHPWNKR